jgi:predicted RNase H-like HicB family nuclease
MQADTTPALKLSALIDKSHENKWVAIAPDYSRILAAAETLRALLRVVSDPAAVYFKVLPFEASFAPRTRGA